MKNKIVMIAAFLAVMVAMTGIAAAGRTISAEPNPIYLSEGGTNHADIAYSGYASSYNIIWFITTNPLDTTTLTTEIKGKDDINNQAPYVNTGKYQTNDGVSHVITLYDMAGTRTQDTYYLITCIEGLTDSCSNNRITLDITIPEFPTVALPVAAVLGLVFFFHSRKKKEE